MTRCLKTLLFTLFILHHLSSIAQHPVWRQYTTADGLPSNEVYGMLQDSRGFMWFTTNLGICRFNGYEFQRPIDTSAYAGNEAYRMAEDAEGNIWFNRLDASIWLVKNDTVRPWKYNYIIERLHKKFVNLGSLVVDKSGTAWIQLPTLGILVVHPDGRYRLLTSDDGSFIFTEVENEVVFSTIAQEYPKLWKKRSNHFFPLRFFHWQQGELRLAVESNVDLQQRKRSAASGSWRLRNGDVILNDMQTFFLYRNNKMIAQWTCGVVVNDIYEDRDGSLLLSSLGAQTWGLLRFQSVEHFRRNQYTVLLPGHSVSQSLRDREGGWWVVTADVGIFYCKNPEIQLFDQSSGLNSNIVQSITSDGKETIYTSLRPKGIYAIRTASETVNPLPVPASWRHSTNSMVRFDTLTGRLWYNPDLCFYERGKWTGIEYRNAEIQGNFPVDAKKITVSKSSTLWWSGAFVDFFSIDPIAGSINRYTDKISKNLRTHASAQDFDGNVWVATDRKGLQLWRNGRYEPLPFHHPALRHSVRLIEILPDSTLVLSLRGYGLLLRNRNGQFTHLTTDDGLSTNWLSQLDITPDGVIYASSNAGLNILRHTANGGWKVEIISTRNGLPSDQVNDVAWLGAELWVATDMGIARFRKKPVPVPMPAPQLENILINGSPVAFSDHLHLQYWQNNLALRYFALHYCSDGNILYRYRLLGADTNFIRTRSREVNFLRLGPGNYGFEIQAQTEEGDWSAPVRCFFKIQPPWWQTGWFRLVIAAFLTLVCLFFYRRHLRIIRQEADERENIRELEAAALRAQMNPHFIFNCLQAIQSFIARNERDAAVRYLARFAKLIRLTLHGSVDGRHTLAEEMSMLENYLFLEQMRFKGSLSFDIQTAPGVDPESVSLPPMLVQPFVENAIIHGLRDRENGHVDIAFGLRNGSLEVTVSDNGMGFADTSATETPKKPYNSLGMMLTQKRLDVLAGAVKIERETLEDVEGKVAGARVRFEVPVETI